MSLARITQLFGPRPGPGNALVRRIINLDHVRMIEYNDSNKEMRIDYSDGQSTLIKGDAAIQATTHLIHTHTPTASTLDRIREMHSFHVDAPANNYISAYP
jgi:hypothetical protein